MWLQMYQNRCNLSIFMTRRDSCDTVILLYEHITQLTIRCNYLLQFNVFDCLCVVNKKVVIFVSYRFPTTKSQTFPYHGRILNFILYL